MSLQVWLPLNGNLHNQGLSDITVTNNGATVDNSGKIGKCYSFDGNDDYISLTSPVLYPIITGGNQPFSITMWVYHADATRAILFGDYGLGGINFNIELTTGHALRFYWAGSPDKNFTITIDASQWTHICLVYDGTQVLVYKNGIIQSDKYTGILATRTKTTGAYYLGRDSRTGTTAFNGKMNDFRLYDHALSAKEVEEIAKGLVLHYKLDDRFCEPTINLLTEVQSCPTYTNINLGQHVGALSPATCTCGNAIITYSAYIKNTSNVTVRVRCSPLLVAGGYSTFQGNIINPGEEGWSSVTCDLTDSTKYTGSIYLYFQNGSAGTVPSSPTFQVYHAQVEQKSYRTPWVLGGTSRIPSIIYDSSGYGNNGTIAGSLTTSTPSPRYSCATEFDGSSYIKYTPFNFSTGNWTASFWYYRTAQPSAYEGFICLSKGNGADANKKFAAMPNNGYIWFKTESGSGQLSSLKTNTWTHIVITSEGKVYENGVLKLSLTPGTVLTDCTDLVIGARAAASGVTSVTTLLNNSNLSDVRIYATALTPEQIKELYNTSMSIDNNGNIHARELVEL